jgi:chitin deacetylase
VRAHPEIVKRCVAEGHAIGNHSDRHSYLTNFFFRARMRREMQACQDAVRAAAGVEPRFYRPPVGLMNHAVVPAARDLGMEVVAWSIRSLDSRRGCDPVRRVVPHLRSRAIVLLHDGGLDPERVLETTRRILDAARERDLAAVAIPVD